MTRILFVCYGNRCRSPMAELIMKDLVEKAGIPDRFHIESAGLTFGGAPVHQPAREKLAEHGIGCPERRSRRIDGSDYDRFDLLIGMNPPNLETMRYLFSGDPDGKLRLLLDYTDHPRSIEDPWYTRDYETAWQDILEGCTALLGSILHAEKR